LASVGNANYSDRVIWLDSAGVVHFSARSNNTSWGITGGPAINDGTWHLIVVVMGTVATNGGGATLYLDGVNVATQKAGSNYAYRTGSRFGSPSNVAWTLGAQTAGTTPTNAVTAGAAGTSYDEFVQFDTTPLSATLLGTGVGSLFRSADV
jgi:hypothetical protein